MTDGSENRTPQSSRPPSSATEIRFLMESQSESIRQQKMVVDLWAAQVWKNLQEAAAEMFPDEAANANDARKGEPTRPGPWQPVPWWMFWKDGRRRRRWKWNGSGWGPNWEYQHVAFVAREALEDYCAPRTFAGEAAGQAADQDRSASYVASLGRTHSPRPDRM